MTRQEKNRLIAEFMGYRVIQEDSDLDSPYFNEGNIEYVDVCELDYDSDWNELMPVVEKIESLGYRSDIFKADDSDSHLCQIWTSHAERSQLVATTTEWGSTKKEAVYGTVVEFINWYNQNKQS